MISRVYRCTSNYLNGKVYKEVCFIFRTSSSGCSQEVEDERKNQCRTIKGIDADAKHEGRTVQFTTINKEVLKSSTLLGMNDSSVEDLEKYIQESSRSLDELLAIDIRPLPPLVRLTCLEAVLTAARKEHIRSSKSHGSQLGRFSPFAEDHWPSKYLRMEHMSRWSDWDLGINPLPYYNPSLPKPSWLQSPQFELLVLTTAASANRLPVLQLLNLAGHLQHIWWFYDPIVYASVLRLVTSQVNELSLMDIFRLASLVRTLPSSHYPVVEQLPIPDSVKSAKDFTTLTEEADLLRSALRMHIISKLPGMESVDVVALLQMLNDLNPIFNAREKLKVLSTIETSMIVNPQQKNLYTLIFIFTRLSLLNMHKRSILNRCIGQLQRKIYLAHRYPGNDQTRWFSAVILAFANLAVGAPQHMEHPEDDSICTFVKPPLMPASAQPIQPSSQLHHGLDLGSFVSAEWIQQVFTNLTGYVATHPVVGGRSVEIQAEIAYALALLGYRANSILDQLQCHKHASTQMDAPLLDLIKLLVGPTLPKKSEEIDFNAVRRLPRVDWQFYYHLASEALSCSPNESAGSDALLSQYLDVKMEWVTTFVDQLRSRLRATNPLEILTFHRISCPTIAANSYFADIVFKLQSKRSPDTTKAVLCFVCRGRDLVVKRPLETLVSTYRSTSKQLPCITFNYTPWVSLDSAGRRDKCDSFLKELAQLMIESPGIPTDCTRLWTDVKSD